MAGLWDRWVNMFVPTGDTYYPPGPGVPTLGGLFSGDPYAAQPPVQQFGNGLGSPLSSSYRYQAPPPPPAAGRRLGLLPQQPLQPLAETWGLPGNYTPPPGPWTEADYLRHQGELQQRWAAMQPSMPASLGRTALLPGDVPMSSAPGVLPPLTASQMGWIPPINPGASGLGRQSQPSLGGIPLSGTGFRPNAGEARPLFPAHAEAAPVSMSPQRLDGGVAGRVGLHDRQGPGFIPRQEVAQPEPVNRLPEQIAAHMQRARGAADLTDRIRELRARVASTPPGGIWSGPDNAWLWNFRAAPPVAEREAAAQERLRFSGVNARPWQPYGQDDLRRARQVDPNAGDDYYSQRARQTAEVAAARQAENQAAPAAFAAQNPELANLSGDELLRRLTEMTTNGYLEYDPAAGYRNAPWQQYLKALLAIQRANGGAYDLPGIRAARAA